MENNNNIQQEVLSYEKNKMELLFNILNSINFVGIQQAQGIAQIYAILSQPIKTDSEDIDK